MADLINEKRTGEPLTDRSTADLVKLASEQISQLVRDELRLAQLELARKGKHAGIGIGLFGGASFVALYGLATLVATAVLALALVLPAWLAALIVAVVLFATAGALALIGRGQVKQATPPVPEQAVDSVKEDIGAVTEAVRERGQR
jgi:multisubunit Na+/H+ antiporter MnhC subunit